MSNTHLIQCLDCGAWNGSKDPECAMCGKQFGNKTHKQDARRDNRRRQKQRFDDEDDDDGDMNGSGNRNTYR